MEEKLPVEDVVVDTPEVEAVAEETVVDETLTATPMPEEAENVDSTLG